MEKKDLINFEKEIADLFNNKKIKSPIHLYSGNEEFLINFFKKLIRMIGSSVHGDPITSVCLKGFQRKN